MENENKEQKSNRAKKEEKILKFWEENKIFESTLEQTKNGKPFVFYDGPPFATGLPHYGHLLAGTIKDAIPRYQTMKGRFVRRKWGWDCHGLPIENLIEEELGLGSKKDIEDLGIGKFNESAKNSVLRYDSDWKVQVPRMGRFIDMETGYKTMDWTYSESVWWAFSELFKKGLIYEGYKTMHICPRCETTLANTEVSQGYSDITDISVTVKFELVDEPSTFILAWTTTPWTLPGNVALAINEKLVYVKIKNTKGENQNDNSILKNDDIYILAKDRLTEVLGDEPYEILEEIKGSDLVGKKYKPVFDYYSKNEKLENHKNSWKIYAGDFVTTESGTGIVHIAPAFGEDDMEFGKEYKLPFIQHVSMDGRFKNEVADFAGEYVKPKNDHQRADILIIKNLAHKNLLFSKKKIVHSYPHCWRCDTPLLNYAASSWFVRVTNIRDKLVSENNKTRWVPEKIGSARFGNWLADARDWAVSRTRFWGAPLPVWRCDSCKNIEVIGSIEDIKNKTGISGNKYFIMRHGEAEHNVYNKISSRENGEYHLTEKGKNEALATAKKIKINGGVDYIFSSPFVRTRETTKLIAEELGIKTEKIIFDKRIGEINLSAFEGKNPSEYHKNFSSIEEKFTKKIEGVETLSQVRRRVMEFLYEIDKKYSDKKILIVTHEYPAWMFVSGVKGADKKESAKMKENKPDFVETGRIVSLAFFPIPHNEDYEIDLHRPYIDDVAFGCDCGKEMHRIPEVFDCWFESGSMPYAQFHYPFENKKEFENNFPADFIAEGLDQTRGWFYNMLILSVGLFDKSAYKNVIVNGMILAEDGKKMSKRLKNYPEPMDVVNKYGADALRYYMLSSPAVHGEDLVFSEKGVDEVYKKNILRLQNVVAFYKMYDSSLQNKEFGGPTAKSNNVLDQWILARLEELVCEVENAMDGYELDKATRPIADFVDDLSVWYIRRSRDRFKGDDEEDKKNALGTTRYILVELSKVLAPFMPFIAEEIYQQITTDNLQQAIQNVKKSVHLEVWPSCRRGIKNQKLWVYKILNVFKIKQKLSDILKEMQEVRRIVSLGLEVRASVGIKVRQPLQTLRIRNQKSEIKNQEELLQLIKEEVNVKEIVFDENITEDVEIDIELTSKLIQEGQARELIRHIQEMRKKKGFSPRDIIELTISTNKKGEDLILEFKEQIIKTALIKDIKFSTIEEGDEVVVGGINFKLLLNK